MEIFSFSAGAEFAGFNWRINGLDVVKFKLKKFSEKTRGIAI